MACHFGRRSARHLAPRPRHAVAVDVDAAPNSMLDQSCRGAAWAAVSVDGSPADFGAEKIQSASSDDRLGRFDRPRAGTALKPLQADGGIKAVYWQMPFAWLRKVEREHNAACLGEEARHRTMQGRILEARELEQIVSVTLSHYGCHAQQFRAQTRDHDVRQNIATLLRHIRGEPPFTILDFGCGPGRDLKFLTDLGHKAIGLEGSGEFVAMARSESGCEVWQQDFLRLRLPAEYFDGVFANASLFHVPCQELPRVLRQLQAALKPAGVLFSSNPRGANEEGWSSGRYGAYHDLAAWRRYLSEAGFSELEHYYRPTGLPRSQQPWLATAWRKS